MARPNSPIPKRNFTRKVTGRAGAVLGNEAALNNLFDDDDDTTMIND
jgi:hypothetical protein